MKANEIMTSAKRTFSKVGFGLQKKSPEILVGVGIVGAVASAVLACKATTKAGAIVEESKNSLADIREAKENGVTKAGESYSEEDHKKDLAIAYVQTGVKFAKLYAPAVMLGAASIASILASHNIMKKRNVALAAAYAAVDKSFKDYRDRVIERFGEQVEKELRYNIKAQEIEETVTDDKGKEKKVILCSSSERSDCLPRLSPVVVEVHSFVKTPIRTAMSSTIPSSEQKTIYGWNLRWSKFSERKTALTGDTMMLSLMLRPPIFPSMAISSGSFLKTRMFLTRRLGSAPANPTKKTVHRLM